MIQEMDFETSPISNEVFFHLCDTDKINNIIIKNVHTIWKGRFDKNKLSQELKFYYKATPETFIQEIRKSFKNNVDSDLLWLQIFKDWFYRWYKYFLIDCPNFRKIKFSLENLLFFHSIGKMLKIPDEFYPSDIELIDCIKETTTSDKVNSVYKENFDTIMYGIAPMEELRRQLTDYPDRFRVVLDEILKDLC